MSWLSKIILVSFLMLGIYACTQDDDGPLGLSSSQDVFGGRGFFLSAELDSGKKIHLADDTLYVLLDSLWSFSNCALKNIWVDQYRDGSALVLKPQIEILTSNDDCASPMFRPETTLKVLLGNSLLHGIERIFVKNDVDSLLDSILVKRGTISLDTFKIFVDSLFDSVHALPVRTKGSPSVLRVLDSLKPRVFLWRTMKSECTLRIDVCKSVIADTIYPSSWSLSDTNLVPVHYACADSDSVYCHKSRWVDDSTSLGPIQQRPDTVWYTSTYYVEDIPKCGGVDRFNKSSLILDKEFVVSRELFTPSSVETTCGPSPMESWYIYDINRNYPAPDSIDLEGLYKSWKSAKVANDAKAAEAAKKARAEKEAKVSDGK